MRFSMPPVPFGMRRKSSLPAAFCSAQKAAVVGCRGLQVAGLQAVPQRFLVRLVAEWRAHDMRSSHLKIFVTVDRIVNQQVARKDFAENTLTLVAGSGDCLERLSTGVVHDVQWNIEYLGDADGAVCSFPFALWWPRQRVALGTGDTLIR